MTGEAQTKHNKCGDEQLPALGPEELSGGRSRILAIDALRGLVIVLMALDHSRDFLGDIRIRPEAIETTTVPLFFTRWVTHLCATTFVFLAGVSAWLYGQKTRSQKQLCWFLVSRGIWLIILEFTVVRFGLLFSLTLGPGMFLVIAAIGASMVLLGACCLLPRKGVLIVGLAIIIGHNSLDGLQVDQLGIHRSIWTLFFRPGYIPDWNLAVGYPILPWFGVMALGYGVSPFLTREGGSRRTFSFWMGAVMFTAFLVLRSFDLYGDPQKWDYQQVIPVIENIGSGEAESVTGVKNIDQTRTLFSFLAITKYPPSLLFVLMTLGPSLMILSLFDRWGNDHPLVRWFAVFGSVPLFFYVLHFYVLHLAAWGLYWIFKGVLISPMHIDVLPEMPPEYGFNGPFWLAQVYIGWIILLLILYPVCGWFRQRKRNGSSRIWSYL